MSQPSGANDPVGELGIDQIISIYVNNNCDTCHEADVPRSVGTYNQGNLTWYKSSRKTEGGNL